jgi:hypothetical protein
VVVLGVAFGLWLAVVLVVGVPALALATVLGSGVFDVAGVLGVAVYVLGLGVFGARRA